MRFKISPKLAGIPLALFAGQMFATQAIAASTEWNVSLWGKPRAFAAHVEKLAELVYEKTKGDFELNLHFGGLSKNKENLDGISIGAFEMAQFCAGYHADKNPSITVLELPFLGVSSLEEERKISQALYQHPAVVKDLARWNATLLMPSPLPQYNIVGVGKPPRTLGDFSGLSVRATGGIGAALKTIGAVPTSMSASEVRQALDSGVVKAVAFAPHAHMSFGTVETGKWWTTNLNPGTVNCPVVANTDALNSLSPSHRRALLGSIDEALDHYASYNGKTMDRWGPTLKEKGIQTITYGDAELANFRKSAAGPAAKAWIKANTAKGLPAQELYNFVTGMLDTGM
jgi:TRAP-type C4-dicarboxylate transport system substrate-binding protein